jgi:hypothetical protein
MGDEKVTVVPTPAASTNPSITVRDEEKAEEQLQQRIQEHDTDTDTELEEGKKGKKRPVRNATFHDYLVRIISTSLWRYPNIE